MSSGEQAKELMISEPKQQQQQLLSCGICRGRYADPRLLPCLHTFCRACLQDYIPAESLSVTCPACRQQSILPQDGVAALQTNAYLLRLLEAIDATNSSLCDRCETERRSRALSRCTACDQNLCAFCAASHAKDAATSSHDVIGIVAMTLDAAKETKKKIPDAPRSALVCCHHDDQALDVYCDVCETIVCKACATDGEHREHSNRPLSEAVRDQKEAIRTLLRDVHDRIPSIQDALASVRNVSDSLKQNHASSERKIREAFETLARVMSQRRDALISELDGTFDAKRKTLEEQSDGLENAIADATGCCQFTFNSLENGNETEVLIVRKEMSEKLIQFVASNSVKDVLPEENDFLSFDAGELSSAKKHLRNFGLVRTNSAVACETSASGEGLKHCWVNRQATVTVTTKDRRGEPIKVGHSSIAARVSTTSSNETNDSSSSSFCFIPDIIDNKNGTYDLTYLIREPGNLLLEIQLYGQPIKGSPFRIKSHRETDSMERPKSGVGKTMMMPAPSTSSSTGVKQKVLTSSAKKPSSTRSHGSAQQQQQQNRVQSNSNSNQADDDLIACVGVKGRNKGEFLNPQGVACSRDGRIVVADSNNQCVQVFSGAGECLLRFGTRGRQAGQLQRPTGVCVTGNGNFLVADYDNKWVSVFGPDGKYINKIGTGKLLGPKGVCADRDGRIVVVDNKASAVFVYQPNGKLIQKFGSRGNDDRHLAGPHFCAVNDTNNDIIVSDFHNHRVKVFDREGTFRFSFGSAGEGNGQFNAPTGVAVDRQGNILVADWGNSRIQVFDSQGSFLSYVNTSADPLYGPQGLGVTDEGVIVVADSGNHCFKLYKHLLQ